jgi:hypothetical protein
MSEGLANPPFAIQLEPFRFLNFNAIPGRSPFIWGRPFRLF